MNVVFRVTGDREDLEATFVKEATAAGIKWIKRASLSRWFTGIYL